MTFKELDKNKFAKEFPVMLNSDLAKNYKVKESTIRLWGAKLNLNKKGWLWERKDEIYILKYYNQGNYTVMEIAAKLGRSKWSVINKHRELKKQKIVALNAKEK